GRELLLDELVVKGLVTHPPACQGIEHAQEVRERHHALDGQSRHEAHRHSVRRDVAKPPRELRLKTEPGQGGGVEGRLHALSHVGKLAGSQWGLRETGWCRNRTVTRGPVAVFRLDRAQVIESIALTKDPPNDALVGDPSRVRSEAA